MLVPSANTVCEPDMYGMAPMGVTVHAARLLMSTASQSDYLSQEKIEETENEIVEQVEKAARELSTAKVDVVAFCTTAGSFYKGLSWDNEIIERIEKESGVPATTTSTAMVEALKRLKISRVAVCHPYVKLMGERLKAFLEGHGVNVVNVVGLGLTSGIAKQTPETIYGLAKRADGPDANGIFISCTNFPAIELIEKLEADVGKPVITANQATLWALLEKVGIHEAIEGFGKLLKEP